MKRTLAFTLLLTLTVALSACGSGEGPTGSAGEETGPVVRVASMLDSEGTVLGSMVIQMLEAEGIPTEDKTKLGTPDVQRAALLEGEIDIAIDYTGSGQYYHDGEEGLPTWKNADDAYARIAELDRAANDIEWLTPAPANNSEFIATTAALADSESLTTMEAFAAYVNAGRPVKLIASQSWIDNDLGLKGFEAAYGFTLRDDQLVALATGNTAEMLSALARGTDGVNFSLTYGTDGQLADLDLIVLEDTKDVPPVYEPTPVVRGEILRAYPRIAEILKPLFLSLDQTKLQQLNRTVALGEEEPSAVATAYLKDNGFLK